MTAGFALTLKVTGLWNFAHAGLMAIAFYTMFFAIDVMGWPLAFALLAGVIVTAASSLLIEVCGLQVFRDRGSGSLTFFIFTLILSEFIIYVLTLLFGTEPETLFKSILSPVTIIGDIAVSDWDELAIATVMTVTLTCDHRVVDGAIGARFLQAFKSMIEDPLTMLV